tara:strand:- start:1575 stop:2732 length:1158 start_codon:yes stop_codon:yes gene_type:complete
MKSKYFLFSIFYFSGFVLNVLVNRYVFGNLSEEEFGKYSYYFNFLMLLVPVFSFNLKDSVLRFFNRTDTVYFQTIFILSCFSFIVSLIFTLFVNIYFSLFFFIIFFNVLMSIFRGRELLFHFNLQRILPPLILLTFVYVYRPISHQGIILFTGLGYFLTCLFFLFLYIKVFVNKLFQPIKFNLIYDSSKQLLAYSIPTILTTLSVWAFNFFDQYIIEYFYSYEYLSDFSAAVRILNIYKVALSIVLVIYPVFYLKNYELPKKIKKVRFLVITGVVLFTLISLYLKDYYYILLGAEKYLSTSYLFSFLVISEGIKFISTLYLAVYSYLKRTIITTYIYMGISLFSILLNYIFVPIFGNIGSATISIIVSIAMIFTTLILNKKYEFK